MRDFNFMQESSKIKKLAVKPAEAAGMLGVSESSIRRLINRGILKPSRAIRHLLIPVTQIEHLMNNPK